MSVKYNENKIKGPNNVIGILFLQKFIKVN